MGDPAGRRRSKEGAVRRSGGPAAFDVGKSGGHYTNSYLACFHYLGDGRPLFFLLGGGRVVEFVKWWIFFVCYVCSRQA
jgi:hypothetical protein